jgi:CelD/BcsL family acetyltransferase involved in cellulose biosynthesis
MGRLRLEQIDSIAGFRAVAVAWDDLWQRSEVTLPTVRAELVAQWIECFAPRAKVRGFLVWDDARLVAALPLVARRAKGVLPVGDLPSNYWSASGELLLDPAADADAVLDLLGDALQEAPWPLLWLDLVPLETPRWRALSRAIARRGLGVAPHVRYRIGQVELGDNFAAFEAGLSKNLRRSLRKDLRRLEHCGPVQLTLIPQFTPDEVTARLREVFEIELRSWKDQPGQAVLKTPRVFDFYCRLARQLAAWGCLRVALLEHGGRPIAGELGWVAKGVYHSFKVAYDERFREFGPGHLLRMLLVEEFCRRQDARVIDFQGPMTDALASWSTRSYSIGRLVIAPNRPASRLLLAGYRAGASLVRRASSCQLTVLSRKR